MHVPFEYLAVVLGFLSAGHCLQSSHIPPDTPLSSLIASAKSHLVSGSPRDALLYFDAAVSRDPANYLTIFQRGAAYLSLGRNTQALGDFNHVLNLKPDFESALLQRARLRGKLADWDGAMVDLEKAGRKSSSEYQELQEAQGAASRAQEAERQGAWEACVSQANVALVKAGAYGSLRRTRAHCRFERGEVEEGISDLIHLLHISPGLVEPHLQISSLFFYALGDSDRGLAQIRKCLHSDPDSKVCNSLYRRERKAAKQLEKLRNALDSRKFSNAISLLVGKGEESGLVEDVSKDVQQAKEAGHIHPNSPNNLYMLLVQHTCEAYRELHMPKRAARYCSEALQLNPHSLHGLLFKSQEAIDKDRFEEAVGMLNKANEHHPGSSEVQSLLQKAKVLLKRSKQKDYYKVLGVSRDADDRTIKRAYRQLTRKYHPDKAAAQGTTKEEAEKKMASINEAYEVLSDTELRSRFDNGDDPNDQHSHGGGSPFHGSPFGPGGGQPYFFHHGGPGAQFKFSGQGFNFPGGFPFR